MATTSGWNNIDDVSLVRDAQNGNSAAHAALMRLYEKQVFNLACRIMKSREDAEDVLQEVFITVFRHLPSFQGRSKFSTWLHRVTLNTALTQLRRNRRSSRFHLEQDRLSEQELSNAETNLPDTRLNPEESLTRAEISRLLTHAMSLVKPKLRAVLVMRDVQGLSIKETAAGLNLSIAAVKTRLLRARLTLREHMVSSGAVTSCVSFSGPSITSDRNLCSSGDD